MMLAVVSPEKIYLSVGMVVRSPGTWREYEQLCQHVAIAQAWPGCESDC